MFYNVINLWLIIDIVKKVRKSGSQEVRKSGSRDPDRYRDRKKAATDVSVKEFKL